MFLVSINSILVRGCGYYYYVRTLTQYINLVKVFANLAMELSSKYGRIEYYLCMLQRVNRDVPAVRP